MNVFDFANPSGWLWALLAIPIILLYVLKIRMRRQRVATLLFWDRLFNEKKPRSWWQRLRHVLSLLLQLAFLLLLVTALVDPLWSWQRRQARRIVLIVDNSASMNAVEDDERTRLDEAKDSARSLVRSLRGGDQMAILSAGGHVQVAIGLTDHQRSLLSAIDFFPNTDGPTDVLNAVSVAERLLAGHDRPGEIIVLSDGCFENIEQLKLNSKVTIYGVGQPLDNVGITRYQVRRNLVDAVAYEVLVDVTNYSDVDRDCRIELNLEGELMDVIPLTLGPAETQTRIVDHTSISGGRLIASIDVEDALAVDNAALAVLPQRVPIPIVLVTQGNVFLKGVLESISLVDLKVSLTVPETLPTNGILVLDQTVPAELPHGKVIAINPQGNCDAWTLGDPISQPIVASIDEESPLTQHVRLDSMLFPDARLLQFTMDFEPLIRDPFDQALLAHGRRPDGDVVVLTGSLEKGDLPLRIAFPVLMKNTIEWFQGNAGELRPAVATGELVSVKLPPSATRRKSEVTISDRERNANDVSEVKLTMIEQATTMRQDFVLISPSDHRTPISLTDQPSLIGPLLETGLWTIRSTSAAGDKDAALSSSDDASGEAKEPSEMMHVACNLACASESDLRPREDLPRVGVQHLVSLGGHSLWFYLTAAAAVLIVVEWWLYQRRIVG